MRYSIFLVLVFGLWGCGEKSPTEAPIKAPVLTEAASSKPSEEPLILSEIRTKDEIEKEAQQKADRIAKEKFKEAVANDPDFSTNPNKIVHSDTRESTRDRRKKRMGELGPRQM